MPRSQSEAEFDQLLAKDKQTLLQSRGAKSPFAQLEVPPGIYYGQLLETERGVVEIELKKGSGTKEKVKRVRIKCVFHADADPRCAPEEVEAWAGKTGYIMFLLPDGNQEAYDRFMATLGEIGIPTEQIVATARDVIDANNQITLADALQMIDNEKPFCKLAVTMAKQGDAKYVNYRGPIKQEELEVLLGHPIDSNIVEAPFTSVEEEEATEEPASDENQLEWNEQYRLWQMKDESGNLIDEWYDQDGNQVPSPVKKPQAKVPPIRPGKSATSKTK